MAKQLEFKKVKGWGGKRRGAGRKNKTGLVNHAKREHVDLKKPLHITIALKKDTVNLRTRETLEAFRKAVGEARVFGLYVIHFSLQSNHLHMIVEAKNSEALGRGMKSFGARLGKSLRKIIGGRGSVFAGRYDLNVLKSPTEMKHALAYVLLNASKHFKLIEHIDDFSSGYAFKEWRALMGRKMNNLMREQLSLTKVFFEELSEPRSWLCREGWKLGW
jgi:REP element-mobilizing transposase RayT